jgi:hypothetical protein
MQQASRRAFASPSKGLKPWVVRNETNKEREPPGSRERALAASCQKQSTKIGLEEWYDQRAHSMEAPKD